jgi:hypothetical protein
VVPQGDRDTPVATELEDSGDIKKDAILNLVTPSVLPRVTTHQSIHKHHDCVLLHEKNKFIATKNDPR